MHRGFEIIVRDFIEARELLSVAAQVFGTREDAIYMEGVFGSIKLENPDIFIDCSEHPPDFRLSLSVWVRDRLPDPQDIRVIRQLSKRLGCPLLIEALFPVDEIQWVYWLVLPSQEVFRVELVEELLNEDPPRFMIDSQVPMQRVAL